MISYIFIRILISDTCDRFWDGFIWFGRLPMPPFFRPWCPCSFNVWHFGPCTNCFVRVSDTYRKSNQYIGNITQYSITRNGISFFAFKSRIEFCCLKHFALNLLSAGITSPWICSSVSLSWGKQINKLNNNKKNREEGVNLGRFIFLIHQRSN